MQSTDLHNLESAAINPQSANASFPDPRSSVPGPEDEISLLDLLLALAKRWRMIVGVTFAAGVIAALMTLMMPNIYTARTMILPAQDDKGMMSVMMAQLGGLAGLTGGVGNPTTSDLYVTMLKSETVKDPIIDRFKLMEVYDAKFRSDAYGALGDQTSIGTGKKDGVITISVDDEEPKRAAAIANAYVEELGKLAARLSITDAGNNRTFFEERLAKTRGDLVAAENALKAFQAKHHIMAVPEQARATIEGVAQLKAQLAAQEIQLSVLRQSMTDDTPEVKSTKASIANIRLQISALESGRGGGAVPGLGSVPELGQEYVRLMREFKIQETLVELLTKQYEMAKLNEAKDMPPFQVLQVARIPEKKSKPARSKLVLGAAFAVFVVAVGAAFVLERFARMPEGELQRWREVKRQLLPFRG